MTFDDGILFFVSESLYGISQPVRKGDLLRLRSKSSSPGSMFLVTGCTIPDDIVYDDTYEIVPCTLALGLIDGVEQSVDIEHLEFVQQGYPISTP